MFVTTVVAGTICLITPFRSIQRPLLRDIIFFIVASFAAYVAMYDGKIAFGESLGFIIMYIVYLFVVIGGHLINRRMKDRRALIQATNTENASKTYGSIQTPRTDTSSTTALAVDDDIEVNTNLASESYSQVDVSLALYLRHAFLPRDDEPWSEKGIFNKVYSVVKVKYISNVLLFLFTIKISLIIFSSYQLL